MTGTSLLALLDDIASILDDVSVLTKIAAKKTAGVLGDDLALNAEQVSGVTPDRELPVVWAVAKGSAINKLILVPVALAFSVIAPWAVTWLLMVGGAFLCFEGFEKLAHKFTRDLRPVDSSGLRPLRGLPPEEFLHDAADQKDDAERRKALRDPSIDLVALEKAKIKGAIVTDFVLSAEIITIALGTVAGSPFGTRLAVLAAIAVIMTVGVYGLVAGIVKLDDAGLHLSKQSGVRRSLGLAILSAAPYLMKSLSFAGTAAMFLVGGGILTHGIAPLHHLIEGLAHGTPVLGVVVPLVVDAAVGVLAGASVLAVVTIGKRALRGART